jgi:hypothetical protein
MTNCEANEGNFPPSLGEVVLLCIVVCLLERAIKFVCLFTWRATLTGDRNLHAWVIMVAVDAG